MIESFNWGFSAPEITPAHGLVAALAGRTDIKLPAYEVLELYVWKNKNEQYQYLLLENTSGNMTADELKSHPQVTQDFEIIKTTLSFYDIGLDLSVKCFDENNFSEQDCKDVNDEIINFLENHSEESAIFTVASSFYKTG